MYLRKTTSKGKKKTYTNHLLVESVRTPKGPRQRTVVSLGDLSARPRSEWLKLVRKVERALVGQHDLFDEPDGEVRDIVQRARERRRKEGADRVGQGAAPLRDAQDAAAWAEAVEDIDQSGVDDLVSVHTDRVQTERPRQVGPVHVGYQFWERLGLDEILGSVGLGPRARTLTCAMVMNRLIHPKSEHAMPGWIRATALEDILGVDFSALAEDALYRNLDRLYPQRGRIESMLAARERTLFNLDRSVYLYDVTSTYFEGKALANPKAKRGYSRDKRPDCKQVLVGLVVNRQGFPIAHEVFEGNKQDRQTLEAMLDLLEERVGLEPGQTVVVDRGMAFDENLEAIESRQLQYVVATRQSERDEWLEDFAEDPEGLSPVGDKHGQQESRGGFCEVMREPSPQNPYQRKSRVWVKRVVKGDHTYVLCMSSDRVGKDRSIRQKQEKRLLKDLGKVQERIRKGQLKREQAVGEAIGRIKERYPRVARYYQIEYDAEQGQLSYPVNEPKRATAEQLDGSYLLKTKREDLGGDELWRMYMLLSRAEAAFRSMKSPLAERPIFHQLEHRVETHIFLCVLAYHLLVSIEKTLLDKGVHTSWATVRETLSTHQVTTVVLPTDTGEVLRIRKGSVPEPQHRELYDLLEVPHQVMRPKKRWSAS